MDRQSTPTYPDQGLPTNYNTPPPTYTQPVPVTGYFDKNFVTSLESIIIIVECALSFIVFVCAASFWPFSVWGGGSFIVFIGVTSWLGAIAWYLFHLLLVQQRLDTAVPILMLEFTYTGIVSILIFICACIASSKSSIAPAITACTVFAWIAVIVYSLDTGRRVQNWLTEGKPGVGVFNTTNAGTSSDTIGGQQSSRTSNITTEPHY